MFCEKLTQHLQLFSQLSAIQPKIEQGSQIIRQTCLSGQTVFACGNGGSAADAQHFLRLN